MQNSQFTKVYEDITTSGEKEYLKKEFQEMLWKTGWHQEMNKILKSEVEQMKSESDGMMDIEALMERIMPNARMEVKDELKQVMIAKIRKLIHSKVKQQNRMD